MMKVPATYNKLQTAGAVALLALGISSQAAATAVFTVDPNNAFGALGGTHPGPFQADFITGASSTLVSLNPNQINQTAQGYVDFNTFVFNNSNLLSTTTGLNSNWQMWAEFSYTLSLASGTYATPGSTYNVTALHADFWVDPSIASATTFTAATNAGAAAVVTHGTDSFKIATADLIAGAASINALGGTGFNTTNGFALLTPEGSSLFTSPVPFYNIQFDEFNNTSQGVFVASDHITINNTSGGIDFNRVPEPATLALLGIGLLGIGASKRRKA
jgi:hypothetical protein